MKWPGHGAVSLQGSEFGHMLRQATNDQLVGEINSCCLHPGHYGVPDAAVLITVARERGLDATRLEEMVAGLPTFIMLVYQHGLANVFKVDALNLADFGRNAKQLWQGSYGTCMDFVLGMAEMGAVVRTAHCDQAGDITHAHWNDGIGWAPHYNRSVITRNNG
jgi:hypothetical protein